MDFSQFASDFEKESWALYAVGVTTIILRLWIRVPHGQLGNINKTRLSISRIRRFGIRKLRWDDYIMINGLAWYTLLCVSLNKVASGGGSNLISAKALAELTPEEKAERVTGSKWVFVSEHSMMLTVWSMKACMLILYAGLTDGLEQRVYFNWLGIFIAIGFVASELALFLSCRPIQQYWAVPASDPQCYTYAHYEIVQAAFNIPGDIIMLLIAIPLIIRLHISTKQKLILFFIFGMGGFIIVAAILTKLYCLVPDLISYVYMNWYFREASVAVYVTNIPMIWPLVKDVSRCLGVSFQSRSNSEDFGSRNRLAHVRHRVDSNSRGCMVDSDVEMKSYRGSQSDQARYENERNETQEYVNVNNSKRRSLEGHNALEIKREVSYTVERSSAEDCAERGWAFGIEDHGNRETGNWITVTNTGITRN